MRKRVVVLGGGVGGPSATHELVKRRYEVEVYEARRDLGGKARSQPLAGTGTMGRRDLPGEARPLDMFFAKLRVDSRDVGRFIKKILR